MVDSTTWDELIDQAGDSVADTFEPLPAGNYDLEVVESTFKWASTGKKMWNVQYKVIDGDHKNRRVFNNIVLSPESDVAVRIFFENMHKHGLDTNFFKTKPSDEAVASAMKGRKVKAKIKQGTYGGDITNEVDRYVKGLGTEAPPAGAGAPPPAAAPPAAPAPPPPASAVTPPPLPGGDEPPF